MLPEIARHSEKFYYFYEIANEGSLQAAARKLGVSAPSLSHAIKQLEAVSGAALFHRGKRGVTLTEPGDKLFAFCRKYFREMAEMQRVIKFPDQKPLLKIKIGTFPSIALYFWPRLFDSLRSDSGISLSITTNRSHAIIEALLRREVDIALTVEAPKHEKLIKHELYKDEYGFYVPGSWTPAEMKEANLRTQPLLYIPDAIDEDARSLRQHLRSSGLTFLDEFELDSLEVIGEFVKRGYGVGILPTKVARTYGLTLKPLKIGGTELPKFGTHRFFLSYRDDLEIPQSLMKVLLESARKSARQLNA